MPMKCVPFPSLAHTTALAASKLALNWPQLPLDFQPMPEDGEVDEFYLWPIEKVAQLVATTTEFKVIVG